MVDFECVSLIALPPTRPAPIHSNAVSMHHNLVKMKRGMVGELSAKLEQMVKVEEETAICWRLGREPWAASAIQFQRLFRVVALPREEHVRREHERASLVPVAFVQNRHVANGEIEPCVERSTQRK